MTYLGTFVEKIVDALVSFVSKALDVIGKTCYQFVYSIGRDECLSDIVCVFMSSKTNGDR